MAPPGSRGRSDGRYAGAAAAFLAALVVALLASPVLAIYEILLGTLAAALGLAASVLSRNPALRLVPVLGAAVALGGLTYVAAGLLLGGG